MTVNQFRAYYPIISAHMTDEEIKIMMTAKPDPSRYYMDRILPLCHYTVTWTGVGILNGYVRLIHN